MYSLKAISLAHSVKDWLAHSRQPHILHVFDQVCNLINERKEILSVVTPRIGNGPYNLVVSADVVFSEYLNTESIILISSGQLTLGNLTINIVDGLLWTPRPAWEALHTKRHLIFNGLKSCLSSKQSAQTGSLSQPEGFPWTEQAASAQADKILPISILSNLSSALAKADIFSALPLTSKLAGLGVGLTPSGDDFIVGAVLAAWVIHPPQVARSLAEEVTNTAAPLTTSLSAAWLKSAGRGEAGIVWHQFFDALISENPIRVEAAINKILNVGATSGADALAGFLGTFQAWKSLPPPKIS